jgi:type VI secretion system protein ImpA
MEAPAAAEARSFEIGTRREAVALLEDVGLFYRAREPSSPIPLLTDRARALAERDFLYLLQQMLPA